MNHRVFKIFYCIVIGLALSLFMAQRNDTVKKRIIGGLTDLLQKEWNVSISTKNSLLNFFTSSVFIEGGEITPHDFSETSWGCDEAKIRISLWDLIFKKQVSLYITIYNAHCNTVATEKGIQIIDHLVKIFTPQSKDLPVVVQQLDIYSGTACTKMLGHLYTLLFNGSFSLKHHDASDNENTWNGSVILHNSHLAFDEKAFIEGISGSNIFFKKSEKDKWQFTLHNTIKKIIDSTSANYIVSGAWSPQECSFHIDEKAKNISLKATVSDDSIRFDGRAPLQKFVAITDFFSSHPEDHAQYTDGTCSVDINVKNNPKATFMWSGAATVDDFKYKKISCQQLLCKNLFVNDEVANANLNVTYSPDYTAHGSGSWDMVKKKGKIEITNSKEIITARKQDSPVYWGIPPHQAHAELSFDENFKTEGTYDISLYNSVNEETREIKGTTSITPQTFKLSGKAGDFTYLVAGDIEKDAHITKVECTHPQEKDPVISFAVQDDAVKSLQGFARYSLLQQVLPGIIKSKIIGKKNKVFASIKQNSFDPIEGDLWIENSKFFIPSLQNILKSGRLSFRFGHSPATLDIRNVSLQFAKGSLEAPLITCNLGSDGFALQNFYAPISINNLMVNANNNFYGFIYGNLLLQKHPEKNLNISGTLVLRKSLVRGDLFDNTSISDQTTQLSRFDEYNKNIDFAIRLINEKPIIINTPTLDAVATIDLQASHKYHPTISQLPAITGSISIDSGNLKFFENNLKIEYGKIQFLTRQLDDPVIDLIAKNRINKYVVTLQVTGSLQKPTVLLESMPELSEEQILGLLFTGSEQSTLQADLAVMVMQNLNTLLLGRRDPHDKASILLNTLSKPLKYVQITPDFSDQSGHSGVKAMVSIPLGKQLKAQFQKNLTTEEDIGVEINYLLSDDINLKLVKDQRGELGSEVELRLKF